MNVQALYTAGKSLYCPSVVYSREISILSKRCIEQGNLYECPSVVYSREISMNVQALYAAGKSL